MLIPVAVFAVLFAGICGAYWMFVVRHEQVAVGVVKKRLKSVREPKKTPMGGLVAREAAMSAIGPLNAFLKRQQSLGTSLQALIDQSGAKVTVGTLLLGSAALALLAFVLVNRFTGLALLGAAAAPLGALLPAQVLRFMRTRRLRAFEDQFPEALDLMSRSLRAGHAFTTGIEMVGAEMPKPIGPEFRLLYDRQNYGMAMPDALKSFADRIPVLDARFFVTAVLIQRESGGNLSEVLDNLSSVIRERQRVKRQMRVLSAHGRITGWVLVCLPPVLAIALMSANPEHRRTMFGDPLGINMMIGAGVLQIIGTYVISKIVNVEYEPGAMVTPTLLFALVAVFAAVAMLAGSATFLALERTSLSPIRRRLAAARPIVRRIQEQSLAGSDDAAVKKLSTFVPKSPKTLGKLRRRLALAGYHKVGHAVGYSVAELAGAAIGFLLPVSIVGFQRGLIYAVLGAIVGYLLPSLWLDRRIKARQRAVQNGLPDALDLLIVCLEAGLAIDQALMKCAEELQIAHPALAEELRLVNIECRAGKPRIEAFKNFASRTKVEDVRSLVSMLIQTDRFGTSIAQALRTHAEVSRTKRRQRAEEAAAKMGVKLVFPLVFCLFPAFYVITLGPAVIKFIHAFGSGGFAAGVR